MFKYVCNRCGSIITTPTKFADEERCDEIEEHTRKRFKYCGGTYILQAVA